MVKLYTWVPMTPDKVLGQTLAPDVGHSALEVLGDGHGSGVYASFWPERDSLIGRITQIWKDRPARSPFSYAQETDPEGGYMQRPADHVDEIAGLDETLIVRLWQQLKDSEYDFLRWNCASVCKLLLLSAIPAPLRSRLEVLQNFDAERVARASTVTELQAVMQDLSASPLIDSHPADLRRLAEAYLEAANG
jgi:hypothetical protein